MFVYFLISFTLQSHSFCYPYTLYKSVLSRMSVITILKGQCLCKVMRLVFRAHVNFSVCIYINKLLAVSLLSSVIARKAKNVISFNIFGQG